MEEYEFTEADRVSKDRIEEEIKNAKYIKFMDPEYNPPRAFDLDYYRSIDLTREEAMNLISSDTTTVYQLDQKAVQYIFEREGKLGIQMIVNEPIIYRGPEIGWERITQAQFDEIVKEMIKIVDEKVFSHIEADMKELDKKYGDKLKDLTEDDNEKARIKSKWSIYRYN